MRLAQLGDVPLAIGADRQRAASPHPVQTSAVTAWRRSWQDGGHANHAPSLDLARPAAPALGVGTLGFAVFGLHFELADDLLPGVLVSVDLGRLQLVVELRVAGDGGREIRLRFAEAGAANAPRLREGRDSRCPLRLA